MKEVPLLDYFQWKLRCEYLSDLHWLGAADASLHEWNDALEYLLGQAPRETPEAAQAALIAGLKTQGEGNYEGTQAGNRDAAASYAGGAGPK